MREEVRGGAVRLAGVARKEVRERVGREKQQERQRSSKKEKKRAQKAKDGAKSPQIQRRRRGKSTIVSLFSPGGFLEGGSNLKNQVFR